jgi:tmRNA-binding protein
MAKMKLKYLAIEMRKKGTPIKQIARNLKISTSTASLWCKEVQLTQSQIAELEKISHDPLYGRRLEYSQALRKEKEKRILLLKNEGMNEIGTLNKRELFLVGVSLYWGEGFKKDSQLGFSNSNPAMLKLFIHWLETCCNITTDRLKVRVGLNINYLKEEDRIKQYWSDTLNIPLSQFQKTFYQKVVMKKEYTDKSNYYGVIRIRISKSTELLRKMFGWIEGLAIQR